MVDKLKVTSSELNSTAETLLRPRPKGPDANGGFQDPDKLHSTVAACDRLRASASALALAFAAGDREAERIAKALQAAAVAYDKLDEQNKAALDQQVDGEGNANAAPQSVQPVAPDLSSMPESIDVPTFDAQGGDIGEDYYLGWEDAVHAIYDHDPQALSLNYFRDQWKEYQPTLQIHAEKFSLSADWDGDAASACEHAMKNLQSWWLDMADECKRLSDEAQKVLDAHDQLVGEHPTENDVEYYNSLSRPHKVYKYPEYNAKSNTSRAEYAGKLGITASRPGKPPAISGVPSVNASEVGTKPDTESPGTPGTPGTGDPGAGGGAGGGGGGTPEMPEMPEMPSMSPAGLDSSAGEQPSGSPSGGGSPSSGQGGGSPSGAGAPSGGMPSGGLPEGSEGMPEVPGLGEPSLKPASAGGGGGGMGGGGGGMPAGPLGPAVGADSVGPSPAAARGGGAPAGAPGGAGVGGMGGGMGGMGGGHGQGQGKEKRRNPNLAEDEDLYVEDRAYTEAVIGRRARKDAKDSK